METVTRRIGVKLQYGWTAVAHEVEAEKRIDLIVYDDREIQKYSIRFGGPNYLKDFFTFVLEPCIKRLEVETDTGPLDQGMTPEWDL